MEPKAGMIVRAKAGRDKNNFFVILENKGNNVLIADGKSRKIEKPKLKSLKHLALTSTVIDTDDLTNKQLKNVLTGFNEAMSNTKSL